MRLKTICIVLLVTSLTHELLAQVSLEHLTNAKWETVATKNLPVKRHENSFVAVGDRFYLLGGRGIKPVNIYNPKTLTWTEGAKSPIEVHHFEGVAYQHKIYIFCAMTGKYPHEQPIKNILIYNTKTDQWETGDEIPENRRRGSAGVIVNDHHAIIISGITDGHYSGFVKWVDDYDFKTGKWKRLADAPRARDHFPATLKYGKVYCLGGRNSSAATNQTFELTIPEVDVYDIKNNSWTTLSTASNLPIPRAAPSASFIGNYLIVIGGETAGSEVAHNEVQALSIKTGKWRKMPNLVTGRHATQVINYKKALYITAGSGNKGGKPELSSIEKFIYK